MKPLPTAKCSPSHVYLINIIAMSAISLTHDSYAGKTCVYIYSSPSLTRIRRDRKITCSGQKEYVVYKPIHRTRIDSRKANYYVLLYYDNEYIKYYYILCTLYMFRIIRSFVALRVIKELYLRTRICWFETERLNNINLKSSD